MPAAKKPKPADRVPRIELTNDPTFPLRLEYGEGGLLLTSQQATDLRLDLMVALPEVLADESAALAREVYRPTSRERWKRAERELEDDASR